MSGEIDDIVRELARLRLRRGEQIDRLGLAQRRENEEGAERPLIIGDRVRITNRVRGGPHGWSPANQAGTITRFTPTRVYITTDSNIPIYRSFANVIRFRHDYVVAAHELRQWLESDQQQQHRRDEEEWQPVPAELWDLQHAGGGGASSGREGEEWQPVPVELWDPQHAGGGSGASGGLEGEEWQPVPVELWDPQHAGGGGGASGPSQPTAPEALAAIPRTVLTANSAVFHSCRLEFTEVPKLAEGGAAAAAVAAANVVSMLAIAGEFGVRAARVHLAGATVVVAHPLTGLGGVLSAATNAAVAAAVATRSRVFLYFARGGGLTFGQKAAMAQAAGADACVIGNHVADPWPYTMRDSAVDATTLTIPTVMVSKEHGRWIQAQHFGSTTATAGGTGNNRRQIAALILQQRDDDALPTCCVCTEALGVSDTVLTLPGCGHTFHEVCAVTWLTRHNTCPYCRHKLPLQGEDGERRRRTTNHAAAHLAHPDFYG